MPDYPPPRSYGRTKARALRPRQAGLVETLLAHLAVDVQKPIDLEALFYGRAEASGRLMGERPSAAPGEFVLEIGFGGGEHLAAHAAAHPEQRFIGVEPFLNGVASCLARIEAGGLTNVRLHHGDARDVLAQLPDVSLDRIDILFPDPWPKKRHWKRRLIQPEFVSVLARVLKPCGEVRFATDWANYAAWTLEAFTKAPRFTWMAAQAADWRTPWPEHVATRYEQKRLGDCPPVYLRFRKEGSI